MAKIDPKEGLEYVFLWGELQKDKKLSPFVEKVLGAKYVCKGSLDGHTERYMSKFSTIHPLSITVSKVWGEIWTIPTDRLNELDWYVGVGKRGLEREKRNIGGFDDVNVIVNKWDQRQLTGPI